MVAIGNGAKHSGNELERRGHRFARYADDFIILVKTQRAGERVMTSVTRFLQQKLSRA